MLSFLKNLKSSLVLAPCLSLLCTEGIFANPGNLSDSSENSIEIIGKNGKRQEIIYKKIEGYAIFEGDIILGTLEEIENLKNSRKPIRGLFMRGNNDRGTSTLWPDGILPYSFSTNLPQSTIDHIHIAISHWTQKTNVRFVRRHDSNQHHYPDYVEFTRPGQVDFCAASMGRIGNIQFISLGSRCKVSETIHEIGHALGLGHEHSRPDRDDYIKINRENIAPGMAGYFNKVLEGKNWEKDGEYDYISVMHYPWWAFSKGDFSDPNYPYQTITPIGPRGSKLPRDALGGDVLSPGDIATINKLYPSRNIVYPGFNAEFYLSQYPDLTPPSAREYDYESAHKHWAQWGIHEGRRASIEFDVHFYLSHYPDISLALGKNYKKALNHWINHGIHEGRRGSREFDVKYYLSQNADLQAAFGTNYQAAHGHWTRYGIREGRRGSSDFDVRFYLKTYSDLSAAFGKDNYQAAYNHWIRHGIKEGRIGIGSSPIVGETRKAAAPKKPQDRARQSRP